MPELVCQLCEGKFRAPNDPIGVALMKEHLRERHEVPEHELGGW